MMGTATVTTLSRRDVTDPVVATFVDEVAAAMKLSLVQALAAHRAAAPFPARPGHSPVVAGQAHDAVGAVAVKTWFARLPAAKQHAVLRSVDSARLAPELRSKARDLRVDLALARPVLRQVDFAARFKALALPQGDLLLERLGRVLPAFTGSLPAAGAVTNKGVRFQVHRVTCVDETNPELPGKDDIAMGGTALAADGTETTINQFAVGKFNDNDEVVFNPPKVLQTFNLDGTFPKTFTVFLALAEQDAGGFSEFLTELFDAIKTETQVILATVSTAAGAVIGSHIGGTVGTAIGGPIGTIIGIVAGLILGALVAFLANVAGDDIFEPQLTTALLETADATFADGSLQSAIDFTFADFGGQYRVSGSWQIVR